jgi:hypothetical protein
MPLLPKFRMPMKTRVLMEESAKVSQNAIRL